MTDSRHGLHPVRKSIAPPQGRRATRPLTHAELEQTFAALESGLSRIEFYKAREPAAVMRTLRTIIARSEPDLREARLLSAIGYEIGHYFDRLEKDWRLAVHTLGLRDDDQGLQSYSTFPWHEWHTTGLHSTESLRSSDASVGDYFGGL